MELHSSACRNYIIFNMAIMPYCSDMKLMPISSKIIALTMDIIKIRTATLIKSELIHYITLQDFNTRS